MSDMLPHEEYVKRLVTGMSGDLMEIYEELDQLWKDMDEHHRLVPNEYIDRLADSLVMMRALLWPRETAKPQPDEVG